MMFRMNDDNKIETKAVLVGIEAIRKFLED